MSRKALFSIARDLLPNTRCIDERTLVYFADNDPKVIEAYVENGEGIDRAGGFAIQVRDVPLNPRRCLIATCTGRALEASLSVKSMVTTATLWAFL